MVETIKNLLQALRAAGEETRLRILGLLGHGELTVSELTQILGQSQPRVSRHLKLLGEARLVTRFQEGTWAFYRLAEDNESGELAQTIIDRIPADDAQHLRDLERLENIRAQRIALASEYFKENAENWNEIRRLHIPEEHVEAALLEQAKNIDVDTMLDVGTGTGRMLEIFAKQISRGIGIDTSHDMLAVARSTLSKKKIENCQARLGDMYNIPVATQSQDLVVIHQVLHYADQPDQAIREIARVLAPGGHAFIVDFAPHQLEMLRDEHAHRRLGFSTDEISGLCQSAGLDEVEITHLEGEVLTVTIWHYMKSDTVVKFADNPPSSRKGRAS